MVCSCHDFSFSGHCLLNDGDISGLAELQILLLVTSCTIVLNQRVRKHLIVTTGHFNATRNSPKQLNILGCQPTVRLEEDIIFCTVEVTFGNGQQ